MIFDLFSRYTRGLAPLDRSDLDDWARNNVKIGSWSPWEGDFSTDHTPQIVLPLKVLGREGPRRVTISGPAAGGKSTIGETFLASVPDRAPGFTAWYAQDEEAAKEFAETRIHRFLDSCEAVRKWFPSNRHQRRTQAIHFPHMSLVVQAANKGNAQSKHIRHLILDEGWMYKPGMMAQLRKRTTRFVHNRTILELATGSLAGDEFDEAWHQGTQQRWRLWCSKCHEHHVPEWHFGANQTGGVVWSREAKRSDGTWNFKHVVETAGYECPKCQAYYRANSANGYALNSQGRYTEPVADAVPNHWSFHWNCICSDFAQLGEIAVEYLQAKQAVKRGTTALLQEFNQKKLAKAWKEEPPSMEISTIDSGYNLTDPWPEEAARFMAVDCQQTHYWVVVRAAAIGSRSRLVACARLESWESVRAFQLANRVNDDCVVVDSGDRTDDVYTACCLYGWIAIKGEKVPQGYRQKLPDGREVFMVARVSADINGRPFEYYPAQLAPGSKQPCCNLILVSDEMSSEVLANARAGRVDGWTIARDTPQFYIEQLGSMQRLAESHPKTNQPIWFWKMLGKVGNHTWDCERYLIAAMFQTGFFHFTEPEIKEETPAK